MIMLQGTNYLLPLLIIPILVNSIGYEKIGSVYFAQSLMNYFLVINDYGFNLTATRHVAVNRENKEKIQEIFNDVISTKIVLTLFSFLILGFVILSFNIFQSDYVLYLTSFSIVLGQAFFPGWYYLGFEKIRTMAFLTFISRTSFAILIFFFVRQKNDFIYVNIILGLGNIFITIYSFYHISRFYKINFTLVSFDRVIAQIKEGFYIFISSSAVNVYTNSNLFILGFFASKNIIGYFSIAEKAFVAIRQLLAVFSQVIYPKVCQLASRSFSLVTDFYKRVFWLFLSFILISIIFLFLFSSFVVQLFTHTNNEEISNMIRILSCLPLVVALNIPAYQILIIYGYKRGYSLILLTGAVLNLLINYLGANLYGYSGTIAAMYVTEIFVTVNLWVYFFKIKSKYGILSI